MHQVLYNKAATQNSCQSNPSEDSEIVSLYVQQGGTALQVQFVRAVGLGLTHAKAHRRKAVPVSHLPKNVFNRWQSKRPREKTPEV